MSNNATTVDTTATAEVTKKTVVQESVTLTISRDAAAVLAVVVGSIGGDPTLSYRKYTDAIHHALREAGFSSYNYADKPGSPRRRITGALSFKDGFVQKPEENYLRF